MFVHFADNDDLFDVAAFKIEIESLSLYIVVSYQGVKTTFFPFQILLIYYILDKGALGVIAFKTMVLVFNKYFNHKCNSMG